MAIEQCIQFINGKEVGGAAFPASADRVSYGNGTVADALDKAGEFTKLWENPSPTSDFAAQSVTLSSSDYDFLMIIATTDTNATHSVPTTITPKGNSAMISFASPSGAGAKVYSRSFTYTSDTEYSVAAAFVATGTSAAAVANSFMIPLAIYGIKL